MIKEMVHLYKDYYFGKYDKLNYALFERKINSKSGNERFEPLLFYGSLKNAVRSIREHYTKEKLIHHIKNDDLEKLLEQLQEIATVIEEEWKGI